MAQTTRNDWFWYELLTDDHQAAAEFYAEVVGWKITAFDMGEGVPTYLLGNVGDRGVVGLMAKPPQMPAGAPSFWSGYLCTEDTDATAAAVAQAGGKVLRAPWDIPQVGRLAVLADPEGGLFNVMKPARPDGPPPVPAWTPGSISWCELHSDDPERNFAWYEGLFGWQRGELHDMGPNGTYQQFRTQGSSPNGGSCGKMGSSMPTGWLFYFSVDGLDAAVERAKTAGGKVFMGPHQVPGGTWIAIGHDPQGAVFALHAQAR